jgi:thioredoxin reductase
MAANGASTEIVIVGAGPVGLFSMFQLGLARLRAVVDIPDRSGGQCAGALLPFFGLATMLGSIADFGLNLNDNLIPVNAENFETRTKGILGMGDINIHPGKLKLIFSGFHEAVLTAQAAHWCVHPDKPLRSSIQPLRPSCRVC